MAVNMLPWLLFALPAGVLADRVAKRRLVIASNLLRAVALLCVIAANSGSRSLAVLYLLAFLLGIAETLFDTAAPAMLPGLVDSHDLARANGRLFAVQTIFNEMLGPPLAGVLIGVAAGLALSGSGAFYLAGAVCMLAATRRFTEGADSPPRENRAESMWRGMADGIRFVASHATLRVTTLAGALYGLVYSAAFSMLVLLSRQTLRMSPIGYGLLTTAGAVGALAGSMLAARLAERVPALRHARWSLVASGAAYIMLGLSRNGVQAGIAIFLNGIFMMGWNVPVVTLRQRLTPAQFQGRVMSVARLCTWGTMPLGALAGGLLARATSVPEAFIVCGTVLITGSAVLFSLRQQDPSSEPPPIGGAAARGTTGQPETRTL